MRWLRRRTDAIASNKTRPLDFLYQLASLCEPHWCCDNLRNQRSIERAESHWWGAA
jgi:hypothetical protein